MITHSVSYELVERLKREKKFMFGGLLEDYARSILRTKASNASRRLRELAKEGLIDKTYEKVPGVKNRVVSYRFKKINH